MMKLDSRYPSKPEFKQWMVDSLEALAEGHSDACHVMAVTPSSVSTNVTLGGIGLVVCRLQQTSSGTVLIGELCNPISSAVWEKHRETLINRFGRHAVEGIDEKEVFINRDRNRVVFTFNLPTSFAEDIASMKRLASVYWRYVKETYGIIGDTTNA